MYNKQFISVNVFVIRQVWPKKKHVCLRNWMILRQFSAKHKRYLFIDTSRTMIYLFLFNVIQGNKGLRQFLVSAVEVDPVDSPPGNTRESFFLCQILLNLYGFVNS